jgi:hypothetical protein
MSDPLDIETAGPIPADIAEQIGYLFVNFANFEYWLYRAFADL